VLSGCGSDNNGAAGLNGHNGATGATGVAGLNGTNGATGATGSSGVAGATGATGSSGADIVFGDGSGNGGQPVNVSGSTTQIMFKDFAADGNSQFVSLTVATGATLYIPSGTTIHCTGTFDCEGSIVVEPSGAFNPAPPAANFVDLSTVPNNGQFISPPASLQGTVAQGPPIQAAAIASGGQSLPSEEVAALLHPPTGGGGGAGNGTPFVVSRFGGAGGGTLTVLAAGAITVNGTIAANGWNGDVSCGGGGGGVIILASSTSCTAGPSSVLDVAGGAGGAYDSSNNAASGGGGGGGLVRLLAPVIGSTGTINTQAGAAGNNTGSNVNTVQGAAGGDSIGGGGSGGLQTQSGTAGEAGASLQTRTDPTALFL
jgi:hypothetical protein